MDKWKDTANRLWLAVFAKVKALDAEGETLQAIADKVGVKSRQNVKAWLSGARKGGGIAFPELMTYAERLGIELGDPVEITASVGSLTFQALPTATVQPGEVYIYHGYRELDINSILDGAALDPYSGFPAYRSACCNVRRK